MEELKVLRRLPASRLEACKREQVRVGPSSTIRVSHNVYSVHSRLRGETVNVRVFSERLEVWYGQRLIETLPRLRGEGRRHINYRSKRQIIWNRYTLSHSFPDKSVDNYLISDYYSIRF